MELLPRIPVSVLDTAPVFSGATPAAALRGSLDLAPRVEQLGYRRYWFAEHHNTPGLATTSPAVLAGRIAALTSTLRVGSGGVMLPNHASLVVAEEFGTLEVLHPGRIDLGLGRAPGTDPATAGKLRRSPVSGGAPAFSDQLAELLGYFTPDGTGKKSGTEISAVPAQGNQPEIWLLGSSTASAQFAGQLGMRYAYAYHFNPLGAEAALHAYRAAFRASAWTERPYAMVAAFAMVAATDQEADWLSGPVKYAIVHAQRDPGGLFPTPEEAERYAYDPREQAMVRMMTDPQLIGSPDTVRRRTAALLRATGADELMAMTTVHDHAARVRSYELLAEALAPDGPDGAGGAAGAAAEQRG